MNNNIAFILLDQVRVDMLGTYGHKIVKTPNMDK
ncbi:arylsulfatase [Fusobacterium varium]|nr:arylsulfatase [Fusobacterium varium]